MLAKVRAQTGRTDRQTDTQQDATSSAFMAPNKDQVGHFMFKA